MLRWPRIRGVQAYGGHIPNSYRVMAFADSIRWLACVVQPVDVPARGRAPRVDRSGCAAPSLLWHRLAYMRERSSVGSTSSSLRAIADRWAIV